MKRNRYFSNPKARGVLLLLFFSLIVGFVLLFRKIGVRPRAVAGVPSLSYAIEPVSLAAGQNFDLILQVNPNNASFYAFELYTSYDPTKVEFQDNVNPSQNINSSYLMANASVNTTTNIITIIGTRTGSPFTGSSNQEIARVKMKVKGGVSGDVAFNWGNNTKLGSNIPIEKINGIFKIGGAVLHIDIPSVTVEPDGTARAQRGQNVDVQVFLTTGGNAVKATDFILPYDDTRLTFQNVVDLPQNIEINPNSGFGTQLVIKNIDTAAKRVIIGLQTQTPVQSSTDILLATIKFVVKVDAPDGVVELMPDTASTVYDPQTQNVLGCVGGFRLTVGQGGPTVTQGPSSTPIPSSTPGPSPTPPVGGTNTPTPPIGNSAVLNLKLKLQGILSRPNQPQNLSVKVTVNSIAQDVTRSVMTNFTVDNNGIWSGQAVFNALPTDSDYKIFIKGPKHLQKRVCDPTPQEAFEGTYNCEDGAITLIIGNNNLDFSGIFQLVGDLPPQDGLVNSYDISLVRNNVFSTNPAILALADLNLDGIADSQDYSLVIAALSIRNDEGL